MNLSELLAYENVSEECELRSSFGFMAFHGGELEEMTDIIASRAAERAGASYYGIQLPDNLEWHILAQSHGRSVSTTGIISFARQHRCNSSWFRSCRLLHIASSRRSQQTACQSLGFIIA